MHKNATQLMDEHERENPSVQAEVQNEEENQLGVIQLIPPITTLPVAPQMQLESANKSMVDNPMFYINPLLNKATSQVASLLSTWHKSLESSISSQNVLGY